MRSYGTRNLDKNGWRYGRCLINSQVVENGLKLTIAEVAFEHPNARILFTYQDRIFARGRSPSSSSRTRTSPSWPFAGRKLISPWRGGRGDVYKSPRSRTQVVGYTKTTMQRRPELGSKTSGRREKRSGRLVWMEEVETCLVRGRSTCDAAVRSSETLGIAFAMFQVAVTDSRV